jgi:hypothetical protein
MADSAIDSAREPVRHAGEVTVVFNEFRRRFTLKRRIDAILQQEHVVVRHVWVCMFHEPDQADVERLLDEFRRRHPSTAFHYVLSTYDFKYYGRFQVALQAPTEYVYIVDDDIVPMTGYVAHSIAQLNALNGAVGTYGWRFPDKRITHYRDGEWIESVVPGCRVAEARRVDVLCCHHFLRTSWLRYFWRDEPLSFRTGEDLYLGRNLYKYGGIRSFVIPTFLDGGRYIVDDEAGVPGTTTGENIVIRDRIFNAIKEDFA